ncbi:MAG: YceI family protein [Gillisia sp.]
MNNSLKFFRTLGSSLLLVLITQISPAQTYKVNKTASNLLVEGTSNIHDWEVKAEDFSGTLKAEFNDEQLVKIDALDFEVIAESLKSGKSAMDKNTYKALVTNKYPKISYTLQKVENIDCTSSKSCKISTTGYLNITGTKKLVEIVFDAVVNGSSITLTGNKTIKMSDYKIDAPTALFGTITTGDQLHINFKTVFTK